ncbi:MAG: hypothetical protein KF901_22275 [Myxococcales bacterium]|nr:hypothetical protein [Myxococcales bacterium]
MRSDLPLAPPPRNPARTSTRPAAPLDAALAHHSRRGVGRSNACATAAPPSAARAGGLAVFGLLLACGPATVTAPSPSVPTPLEARAWWDGDDLPAPPAPSDDGAAATRGAAIPPGIRGRITQAIFSPDASHLAVATSEKVVALLDAQTGALRAARRIRVRRDAGVTLSGFDATGRRLLLSHHGYDGPGAALVWDLARDEWATVEEASLGEDGSDGVVVGVGFAARGVVIENGEGFWRIDDQGRRTLLAPTRGRMSLLPDGVHAVVSEGTDDASTLISLANDEPRRVARVRGAWAASRPLGGLFVVRDAEHARVVRVDGSVAATLELSREGRVHWSRADQLVVDAEGADGWERQVYDGRSGALAARIPLDPIGPDDLVVEDHVVEAPDDGSGVVTLRPVARNGERRSLLPPYPEDHEPLYDDIGEELGRTVLALSADRARVALLDEQTLRVFEVATGRELTRFDQEDRGGASVWGVVPTPQGLVVWGRSHVAHWSAHGARVFACRGEGVLVGDDESPGWVTGTELCAGDLHERLPYDDETGAVTWAAGLTGSGQIVVWAGQEMTLRDPRTLRVTQRSRPPLGAVECYEDGCMLQAVPFGRGTLVSVESTWLFPPRGRPSRLGAEDRFERVAAVAGERALLWGDEARIVDPRGRTVREVGMGTAVFEPSGERLARQEDAAVRVETTDDGRVLARFELETDDGAQLTLRGDSLVARTEQGSILWHVPTGERGRFPASAAVALDASGARAAVCAEGRLSLMLVAEGRRERELGACELADSLSFVASDRMIAIPSRTQVTIVRIEDGARLVVHGYGQEHAYAEDGEHVWASPALLPRLRWRAGGPIAEPELAPATPRADPELLRRFFSSP